VPGADHGGRGGRWGRPRAPAHHRPAVDHDQLDPPRPDVRADHRADLGGHRSADHPAGDQRRPDHQDPEADHDHTAADHDRPADHRGHDHDGGAGPHIAGDEVEVPPSARS